MPSEPQQTLIHTIPVTEYSKGHSATARLRASFSSHEDSVVGTDPVALLESGAPGGPLGGGVVGVNLHGGLDDPFSLRNVFSSLVIRGTKVIPGSGFPASTEDPTAGGVSLDYADAPTLGENGPTPEGENSPGSAGSTIHASGLGPNVNIHGTLGPDGDRAQVDAAPDSVTPFVGSGDKSPHESTVYNALNKIPAGAMGDSEETVTG